MQTKIEKTNPSSTTGGSGTVMRQKDYLFLIFSGRKRRENTCPPQPKSVLGISFGRHSKTRPEDLSIDNVSSTKNRQPNCNDNLTSL